MAWFPLAPGEAWQPGYRASPVYISNVNRNIAVQADAGYAYRRSAEARDEHSRVGTECECALDHVAQLADVAGPAVGHQPVEVGAVDAAGGVHGRGIITGCQGYRSAGAGVAELGRRDGFKIHCPSGRVGSIPTSGINSTQRFGPMNSSMRAIDSRRAIEML